MEAYSKKQKKSILFVEKNHIFSQNFIFTSNAGIFFFEKYFIKNNTYFYKKSAVVVDGRLKLFKFFYIVLHFFYEFSICFRLYHLR